MPIELVLAASDYECPCIMSLAPDEELRCAYNAEFVIYVSHHDDTAVCDQPALPFCGIHTEHMRMGLQGSPLLSILGVPAMPPCACGKIVKLVRITTLRGEEVA